MLKKYEVIIDDGRDVYKLNIPATSRSNAKKYVEGNGEIVSIKEIQLQIGLDKLRNDLTLSGWGSQEMDFIIRALSITNIGE